MKLTELEKTILLSTYVLAKGSTRKYILEELILSKFPIRQRRDIKKYLEKMVKRKFLSKSKSGYKINKKSLKVISSFLVTGPRLRI